LPAVLARVQAAGQPASIDSRLMRSTSSSGIFPPFTSASSSLGMSSSSTKRRARS
jgi:hypothetical protein